jgi:hypothetical protein
MLTLYVLGRQTAVIRFDSHLAVPADEGKKIVRVLDFKLTPCSECRA